MLTSSGRRGATLVEFAVISSSALFLIFALVVGGAGIFRYQEVAHLAREGARYASTHGGKYQQEGIAQQTGVAAVASSADLASYLANQTVLLDPASLQVSVTWSAPAGVSPVNLPVYMDTSPNLTPPGQSAIQNYVTVTLTYQWTPEMYLVGPITLTSTSQVPMSY